MFRKCAGGIYTLVAALTLLGACAGESKLRIESFSFESPTESRLEGGRVYYVEVSGNINVPGMGAIFYKNAVPDKGGNELVVLVNGISPNIWQKVIPALVQAGGFVAGSAVYGISLEAAKTAVNTTVTAAGGSATGGTSSSTGGKVCTESGSGDITGC